MDSHLIALLVALGMIVLLAMIPFIWIWFTSDPDNNIKSDCCNSKILCYSTPFGNICKCFTCGNTCGWEN